MTVPYGLCLLQVSKIESCQKKKLSLNLTSHFRKILRIAEVETTPITLISSDLGLLSFCLNYPTEKNTILAH